MTTDIARIYRPNEFHRDTVMHPSNHDPLWLHNFGQPGYVTPIDYGAHVARELALQAAYVASGAAGAAAGRYALALAALRKPRKAAKAAGIFAPRESLCRTTVTGGYSCTGQSLPIWQD